MRHGPFAIVDKKIGEGEPIRAVSYLRPIAVWDSGFALFAGTPEETEEAETELVCLHCVITDHPEIGAALDIARETGEWDLYAPERRGGATWRVWVGSPPR